jgi:ssDNA-binding replication factor A large subunit
MIKIPLDEVKQKILEKSGITAEELQAKIRQKMDLLSGLISQEGACHIIANELGIKLVEQVNGKLQIKNVLSGMRNVDITGKASAISPVREFAVSSRHGKVASFTLADESGAVRVVLWNSQTDSLQNIQEGTVVQVSGAYVRDNQGRREVHCNERSALTINPAGVQIGEVAELQKKEKRRKSIKDLHENDNDVEILGTIVQVYDPKFYPVCPQCFRKPRQEGESWVCDTHQLVTPTQSCVMNLFLDDGTENIRTVFFRNQLEKLLNKPAEEMLKYKDMPEQFTEVKTELLGRIVKVVGKVNKNAMFDRLEFVAQLVFPNPDPAEEIKRLDAEMQQTAN